jgi:hypothetical protein
VKIHFLKDADFRVLPEQQATNSFSKSILLGAALAHMNHNPYRTAVLYNFNA